MDVPGWAAQYIGVPYRAKGRDPGGWDCWGCARWIWHTHYGIDVPSYVEAYQTPDDALEIAALLQATIPTTPWREIPMAERQPGDGLLLRVDGHPWHVAVLLTDAVFLHVFRKTETCLDRIAAARWNRRLLGVYRHGG